MVFQKVNTPLETDINTAFNSILNSFRYNMSNWIYIPGSGSGSYQKRREHDCFLLSSNTKRFMVLLIRNSSTETDDALPGYKVQANCFIDGDYQHTITQTYNTSSIFVNADLINTVNHWLHVSYVVFDFTPSETQNGILVTNSDGVPTKGLFSLELLDLYNKKVQGLPFNTYIRFISIGSGIDTTNFAYPLYKQAISSGFMDVCRDIMTGQMIGYSSKTTPNSYLIEDDSGYPYTQMCYQNIIIPTGALDISSGYNPDFMIDLKTLNESDIINNLLNTKQKCILMTEDQFSIWIKQDGNTISDIQTLSTRLNSELTLFPLPYKGDISITKESGTTWSLKANNILVVQPLAYVYPEDDGILSSDSTPLVLPQTSKSITSDRPIDDGVINYIYNLYNLFFKHKEYCLTNVNSYNGGDIDITFKIKEIAIPCYTEFGISKSRPSYTIMVENWNSDTTHNVYIDLIP